MKRCATSSPGATTTPPSWTLLPSKWRWTGRLELGAEGQGLTQRLQDKHGVRVVKADIAVGALAQRVYDQASRTLQLSPAPESGQSAFQMATRVAFLEMDDVLRTLAHQGTFSNDAVRA